MQKLFYRFLTDLHTYYCEQNQQGHPDVQTEPVENNQDEEREFLAKDGDQSNSIGSFPSTTCVAEFETVL